MKRLALVLALTMVLGAGAAEAAMGKRIQVTGEVIDTWCYISQIMIGQGAYEEAAPYARLAIDYDRYSVSGWQALAVASEKAQIDGVRHGVDASRIHAKLALQQRRCVL